MTQPRCIIADDHPGLIAAVGDYLGENGYDIIGRLGDGLAALAQIAEERPELALVDYRMPRCSGGDLVRRIKDASPETRVAVYTADADEKVVAEVLAAGADGVVLKEAPLPDLVRALSSIERGRPYVDPGLAVAALGRTAGRSGTKLTERELQVLTLLAEGLSHEEIGNRLQIAAETVRTHARKAAERLGARTRTQAVASAIRLGIL
jgi:two-component system, NarL family, nitrate/nitrite response regulator NarL